MSKEPFTGVKLAELKRAANALRKAGNTREAKRLERNLPADQTPHRGKPK